MIYDSASGERLLKIPTHSYAFGLAFSSDGKRLALGSYKVFSSENDVVIWDLHDGRGLRTLRGLKSRILKTMYSGDKRLIVGLTDRWEVAVWARDSGALLVRIEPNTGFWADNSAMAFSADGRRFAFSAGTSTTVWDLDSGRMLGTWELPPGLCDRLSFEDADHLILIREETADTVPVSSDYPAAKHPRVAQFRRLTVGNPDVKAFKTITEFPAGAKVEPNPGKIAFVIGRTVAEGRVNSNLIAYDASTGAEFWRLPGADGPISESTETVIARKLTETEISLLNPLKGTEINRFHVPPDSFWLGPSGKSRIAIRNPRDTEPGGVLLYDMVREEPLVRIILNVDAIAPELRFSRDGQTVIWGNRNGTITLFELADVNKKLTSVRLGW